MANKNFSQLLDGLKKTEEYNKNLKFKKDNVKKMNRLDTPLGTIYTSSGRPNNRTAKSIFVKK
jgi:hypothetical protein